MEQVNQKRLLWNLIMFTISFTCSNFISGVIYDSYVNYLQDVSIQVATSFWSYYGYATFISAFLVLLVNKIGFKYTLLLCPLSCILAIFMVLYIKNEFVYSLATLCVLVGLQLHYVILASFTATYTNAENKTAWYSKIYYIGYTGWLITTFLGGLVTVFRFAQRSQLPFNEARLLTGDVAGLTTELKEFYMYANKDVLLYTGIIAILSLIPVFLLKEEKKDYTQIESETEHESLKHKIQSIFKTLTNKYALSYLVYWCLISLGMGFFTPYLTVFLNRNLNIDRVTASFLVSFSYLALVLFMTQTPRAVKRFGQIITLGGAGLLSIPFMITIAMGDSFGVYMIPVVGAALFLRSGFMNLGFPIDSSLPMELVPANLRPAYSSLIFVTSGLISILAGIITEKYIFTTLEGYRYAYFYASAIYVVASLTLLITLYKKFNIPSDDTELEV